SNASDAMVPWRTLSPLGVLDPSTPSGCTGHNPLIAVDTSEFLEEPDPWTVVGWKRAYPCHRWSRRALRSPPPTSGGTGRTAPGGSSTPTTPPQAPRTAGPQGRGRVDRSNGRSAPLL